ncbi:hypothetical protein WN55_11296 [Dufourea novaeangliae]|uniref:C2H2-type domain-containing protein n=1 Tax=Dufourea novaeangliae TaxID=178035 RepID=A0A154PAC6_DUFNO|nr:hypothetical protein WN55_11296 [Dufourea novaeangliae]
MVASTHNLDDLGVSHPASANGDRQQQQEKHGHTYRSAQTAQDKRSRLSNVINNLRKKVPDSRTGDSPRKEEDDRNSVERNLETLEKYVMTVLNGVIKDEEEDGKEVGKKECEKGTEPEKLPEDQEDEDSKGPGAKFEPSKPNESRTETAVFLLGKPENVESGAAGEEPCLEYMKLGEKDVTSQQSEDSSCSEVRSSQKKFPDEEVKPCQAETNDDNVSKSGKCSSKEVEDVETAKESFDEEKKENRSLGTIIMERLSDHQSDEKISNDFTKEDPKEFVSENVELRNVCRDLLNDLLNGINQLIDENSQEKEEMTLENSQEDSRNTRNQDLSMTSLHCSLPLDKVASVLQNCQTNDLAAPQSPSSPSSSSSSSSSSQGAKSPIKPPSPTVRHLCLYCDRKFLSISLRQRHTERVHQQGGGRRSERNSRKPSQNCQYCSDKCAESLDGLFQHMVGSHGDKYHACVQCSTRYPTREALVCHMTENHGVNVERNLQEKMKESSTPSKDLVNPCAREKPEPPSPKERRPDEPDHEHRTEPILLKPVVSGKETFSNPGSPEFDSSFYSSVSCNIRENLLHHLDGKLQSSTSALTSTATSIMDSKLQQQPQQQQSFYEHNVSQIQLPIDISLTAATPVYSKEYTNEDYENSSEYAQKPGKSNWSHPRRVSFEKYNFPRKYDGKEQWTCSIKDLSKFDISTQLTLRKKQQLLKERITLNRIQQTALHSPSETTNIDQTEILSLRKLEDLEELTGDRKVPEIDQVSSRCDVKSKEHKMDVREAKTSHLLTEFTPEFGNFLRLRKWDEKTTSEEAKKQERVYAELTGEWSRPRIYICGACAAKHVTLREMEDHKASTHPNVWCSHFEFSGDQRELYKHLFLPGKDDPTAKAKAAILVEKVCTKCSRNCNTLPELHRHMLECGGDQAWLLGLFGNGKKKCKWRPFGSRSRRRRQRGMKRNIQNSQTPRMTTPKEKQPTGPRVRPSDRESIQKMLANLPPKRATRKVMQDSALRTQGRLRNVQTRSRPRMVGDISTASRMSRNKAALRNKLLKNAKSIQRNRCRIDNISAVIESVVRNYNVEEKRTSVEVAKDGVESVDVEKDAKETKEEDTKGETNTVIRGKISRGPRILGKKRNIKIKEGIKVVNQPKKPGGMKGRPRSALKNPSEAKVDAPNEPAKTPKSVKVVGKVTEKATEVEANSPESKSPHPPTKIKVSTQTTPKKKRPVDPVASLNASIKAKSQLRSQDGKFARNPNKSPQKSPEVRPPSRQVVKGKGNKASPDTSVTRSKLRTTPKSKTGDQLPKRITRLSSDSDKMPTLEPAVQIASNNEEDVEASANDLPILSPANPSSSAEKVLRGKSMNSKNLDDKENPKKGDQVETVAEKKDSTRDPPEDKDLKQTKVRRQKVDAKNLEKSLENVSKDESLKEKGKGVAKEKFKRKSAPGRIVEEKKVSAAKTPEETTPKKDSKQKALETRSNSRAKLDKTLDTEDEIKIQSVPFEVKKLIGSDCKEDLLTKLVLTSRATNSKRCLRQPVPKAKGDQGKSKVQKDLEFEKFALDSELITDMSGKKEKIDRRKSLRKTEKKLEKDKRAPKNDQTELEEVNKLKIAVNEVKTAIRGRRSSSLSSESKSVSSSESQTRTEIEVPETSDNENTSGKRQTRGSLLNANEDQLAKETSVELNDMSLKKNTSLGKRRGRIKSNNDTSDRKSLEVSQARSDETDKNSSIEIISKDSDINTDDKATIEDDKPAKNDQEEPDTLAKVDQPNVDPQEHVEVESVNMNVNRLQIETGSSMDSGKENSLETVVGPQKLKVGRPRKSWGSKRERASKRSLNNVIGILTEGMNIPVESQQSVVLTVQTSLDNVNPDGSLQTSGQPPEEGSSKSLCADKSDKTEIANDPGKLNDDQGSCVPNPEEKQPVQTPVGSVKELNGEVSLAKTQNAKSAPNEIKEPTNDIILDLSRRKQKGKGSFLEKIVSKIAKQKDALLEGEVGSLLDTAADELTSILDEVGPGLSEAVENPGVGKPVAEKKVHGKRQEEAETNVTDENCQESLSTSAVGSEDTKASENMDIEILNNLHSDNQKEAKESTEEKNPFSVETESSREPLDTRFETESLNREDNNSMEIQSVETESSRKPLDTRFETESLNREDNNSMEITETDAEDLKMIVLGETNSVPNGITLPESISQSIGTCTPKPEEKSPRNDQEPVTEDTKVKRKSKKRSLEGNSPKKNKRKSVEPADEPEECVISEELHLADIMKLINRTKEVPSTKENIENDLFVGKVQLGKRKTLNDESETRDLSFAKVTVDLQRLEESTDPSKKLKTEAAGKTEDGGNKVSIGRTEDRVNEETLMNVEQNETSSLQVKGKRKSSGEKEPEIESPVRRSSKRRSLVEDKLNQEDELLSKDESETSDTTRRRSSRTKFSIQSKNEGAMFKEPEGDVTVNNVLVENIGESLTGLLAKGEPLVEPTSPVAKQTKVTKEDSGMQDPESEGTEKENGSESVLETGLKEPQNTPPKVPKKRGRKKKLLISESTVISGALEENNDSKMDGHFIEPQSVAVNQVPSRKSLRVSRPAEELEDQCKNSDARSDHFKIPEVTEVLQHTKKRTSKRKSTTDEHLDNQSNLSLAESESNADGSEAKAVSEKGNQLENTSQKDLPEGRKRASKSSNSGQVGLERSSSSGSIDLTQTSRTRSSKRKQLSSEDLSGQEILNRRAESTDNLSESSCVSESSYFRKKRFSKKKKASKELPDDVQTDTSITDSESADTERNSDRRQSLKRRAKKNISFFEDQFDLVDDFDIPMDIEDCLQQQDIISNIPQELETKLSTAKDKVDDTITPNVTISDKNEEEVAAEKEETVVEPEKPAESKEPEKSIEEEEEEEEEEDEEEEDEETSETEKINVKTDDTPQVQEDFQAPKKRAAGNFVVVHKKTGEILIVEKRKKLTKEAARFFCDVCATSFTRKSSLKKHNLSQSHLLQLVNSKKDKGTTDITDEDCNTTWKSEMSSQNETLSEDSKNFTDDSANIPQDCRNDQKESNSCSLDGSEDLEAVCTASMEQELLIDPQMKQRTLEDELLDEEICKITENMSHDEYVLTEHTSPIPECASTPIKTETKKLEEPEKKKKHERKKDKGKKKNLIDEPLDTSEPEILSESPTLNSLDAKSLCLNSSETLNAEIDLEHTESIHFHAETTSNLESIQKEESFKNKCLDGSNIFMSNDDQDMEIVKEKEQKQETNYSDNNVYDFGLPLEKTDNSSKIVPDDEQPTSKNDQPQERHSLKLTISKRNKEYYNQTEIDSNESKPFKETDSFYSSVQNREKESVEDSNDLRPVTDQHDAESSFNVSKDLKKVNKRNIERVKDVNEAHQVDCDENNIKVDGTMSNEPLDQQTQPDSVVGLQSESMKSSRHTKVKKGKSKKHLEEVENPSDLSTVKKTSKSKDNQSRQLQKELVKLPETIIDQESTECSETLGLDTSENEKQEFSLSNLQLENDLSEFMKASNEDECRSIGEVFENPQFCPDVEIVPKKNSNYNEGRIILQSFHEEDEASSSSLEDKPLSEILLMADEKLQADIKQEKGRQSSNILKNLEESKLEVELENQDCTENDTRNIHENDPISDENEMVNNEQIVSQIPSEEESEILKPAEDSDKNTISSEHENVEAVPKVKVDKEAKTVSNGRKSNTSERQNLNKKASRSQRYGSKDSHRRSKNKKISLKSKIADLTSESDDSDAEDKKESQNKSKIVKSVFGRVFGCEKTDKVKEVLNDWVSKSEDDSDMSRPGSTNDLKTSETKQEDKKRHSISSSAPFSPKKRTSKKPTKSSFSDRTKDQISAPEIQEEHRSGKHNKSKNSNNRKKSDPEASNYYFLVLPPTSCRPSKKRAEERISRAFEDELSESNATKEQKAKQKEANYGLRNQSKDSGVKDNGPYNYHDDPSKLETLEEPMEKNPKLKKRKSSASRKSKSKSDEDNWDDPVEKDTEKSVKESGDKHDSVKNLPQENTLTEQLSVDLESSNSCSSVAPSSVRNRSPSLDRNSQTTRNSEIDEEENEDMGHRRISPLFVCGTPRSSIESSSNSENEEEDENLDASETAARKRSSSEFSGEKIVIRSPSSTHKTEMVTIAPTDAIEDNALDVPQEIEAAKPRQGKVLNFDEELFVECCSRLKATTENELRGAKKIKLDHSEGYHRKEDQQQGFRGPRDRWRDVESQNSLGSLLESVNQLLGEEMYSTRERDYPKRGGRNIRSEHSSRSASPDISRADNLGYEDSLDVAFEHNNMLRDKIQQRMRESESLIASTFGQKSSNEVMDGEHPSKNMEQNILRNSYARMPDGGHLSGPNLSNGDYNDDLNVRNLQEQHPGKLNLESSGFKSKMNSALGGLLDKALSNLLHNNGKHDHNGSTPMKVLAELACARAPTSTTGDLPSQEDIQVPMKISAINKECTPDVGPPTIAKDLQKKVRNPIKELFERKKEMNERKQQQEKSKTEAALRELNVHRQRKTKKTKKHQDFPLIRRNEHGGLVERKKRRDGFERKEEFSSDRIKDVYEFDEEESQIEPNLGSVMSYRSRPGYEVNCIRTKEVDVAGLMSKAIGDTLENGKASEALSSRLESMIDRKFKELEKFAPKTKGALKAFQSEERQVTGPMDDFVERRQQQKPKRPMEQSLKHSKLKKRSKNPKKKPRNAWYENDSSDEYRTAVKAEDVGVGISKSQRTCSKGKQNIFAELYTSSESEFDDEDVDYETKRQRRAKKVTKKVIELGNAEGNQELVDKYCLENEDREHDWGDQDLKDDDNNKNDCDNKKSESEMSEQPLVIDERKDSDEQRNSDEETETQYERNFDLDDLYREDSSVADSDIEEPIVSEAPNPLEESKVENPSLSEEKTDNNIDYMQEDELIPLEEALDLLDQADTNLEVNYDNFRKEARSAERIDIIAPIEPVNETPDPVLEAEVKPLSPVEEQEEEPDNDLLSLPEKLSTNEKPQKESDNLPLHVFLSRKVQESKKRKEQQLKKMQEEQERILMDFQPTRRQRKCAIGKQGLLAEISSSDEEISLRDSRKSNDKSDHEKPRKQKRESKEKRKERYIEKKHEQMIAKEQKAIEEEILRELGKKKESLTQCIDAKADFNDTKEPDDAASGEAKIVQEQTQKKKHQTKEKQKKLNKSEEDVSITKNNEELNGLESNCSKSTRLEGDQDSETNQESANKLKKHSKSPMKPKKNSKGDTKVAVSIKKGKSSIADKSKSKTDAKGSKDKERRSSSGRRDSDDEELKTTKSWNKVEEGVGVAIGRRKRAAANQLYYWSSSSDEEEMLDVVPAVEEEEDDRQEQHGWIVGDSHKRMITMLAMEKQLKEKRRRSEDEFEPGKTKSKKHRNSTS